MSTYTVLVPNSNLTSHSGKLVFIVQWLGHIQLFVTPWTGAGQAPLSPLSPRVFSNSYLLKLGLALQKLGWLLLFINKRPTLDTAVGSYTTFPWVHGQVSYLWVWALLAQGRHKMREHFSQEPSGKPAPTKDS